MYLDDIKLRFSEQSNPLSKILFQPQPKNLRFIKTALLLMQRKEMFSSFVPNICNN